MGFRTLPVLLLASALSAAQSEPPKKAGEQSEDHQPSIHGIRIGMTTPQVLDLMGGRMPDARKDEKGEIIVFWKLEGGDTLQVNFRQENYVSHIALQYRPTRRRNDFNLGPLVFRESRVDSRDPRWRVDYKVSETDDKQRVVWVREEKESDGYRIEVQFLSGAKKQFGDQYFEQVEFKYVSVKKYDLDKFDKSVAAGK